MSEWQKWFAWFPVKSVHLYGGGFPIIWMAHCYRRKAGGAYEYTHWSPQ